MTHYKLLLYKWHFLEYCQVWILTNQLLLIIVFGHNIARQSFENVPKWIQEAKTHRGDDVRIVIVGNKLDDEENRQVSRDEGYNLAKEMGLDDL